jgi:hypothetical protein
VYHRVGASYRLLFTRSPVNPLDARLLEAIAFDAKDAKPLLATAYFTVYDNVSQQSFVEVFDLSRAVQQQPIWTYRFVNTTRQFQDSVAGIQICGTGAGRVVAVASWGVGPNSTNILNAATVHAFAAGGSKILSYNTPGSMFGVQCAVSNGALFVGAGGKHEHANIMGSGGDVYGFTQKVKLGAPE